MQSAECRLEWAWQSRSTGLLLLPARFSVWRNSRCRCRCLDWIFCKLCFRWFDCFVSTTIRIPRSVCSLRNAKVHSPQLRSALFETTGRIQLKIINYFWMLQFMILYWYFVFLFLFICSNYCCAICCNFLTIFCLLTISKIWIFLLHGWN